MTETETKNRGVCNGVERVPARAAPAWPPAWLANTPAPNPSPAAARSPAAAPTTDPAAEPPATPTPDPYARLVGPYGTPWRTWAWSDPEAPELEAFINATPLPAFEDLLDRPHVNGHRGPAAPKTQRRAHQEELWPGHRSDFRDQCRPGPTGALRVEL
jgi:hypothetical protein